MFSLAIMRRRLRANTQTPALVLACAAIVAAESRAVVQKFPSNGAVGADQITSVEILAPTEGVDFNGYVTRLIKSVRQKFVL